MVHGESAVTGRAGAASATQQRRPCDNLQRREEVRSWRGSRVPCRHHHHQATSSTTQLRISSLTHSWLAGMNLPFFVSCPQEPWIVKPEELDKARNVVLLRQRQPCEHPPASHPPPPPPPSPPSRAAPRSTFSVVGSLALFLHSSLS